MAIVSIYGPRPSRTGTQPSADAPYQFYDETGREVFFEDPEDPENRNKNSNKNILLVAAIVVAVLIVISIL